MENNYLIRLRSEGLPCWHIIRASKLKEPLLKKIESGTEMDVSLLGVILESGWGKEIPDEIKEKYSPHGV